MPRKKEKRTGSVRYMHREKKARFLLGILKDEHDFDIVKEIVKTYHEADSLLDPVEKMKLKRSIQRDLMKYCFPVLKSTEIKGDGAQTMIHLHIPMPTKQIAPAPILVEDVPDAEIEPDAD